MSAPACPRCAGPLVEAPGRDARTHLFCASCDLFHSKRRWGLPVVWPKASVKLAVTAGVYAHLPVPIARPKPVHDDRAELLKQVLNG